MAIILIGGTGTGKSTVGKLISMNIGYKIYEIGYIVKMMFYKEMFNDYSKMYKSDVDVKNFTNNYFFTNKKEMFIKKRLEYIAEKNKKNGSDYFLRKILEKEKSDRIIIIGVRSAKEIETIKEKIQRPFLVGLKCDETRLTKRFVNREINRMEKTVAANIFERRRLIETGWGIEEEIEKCDLIINTDNYKPSDVTKMIISEYLKFIENKRKEIIKDDKRIIY